MGFHRVYIGVILGIYWGYIGIMEKKMETTITGLYNLGVRVCQAQCVADCSQPCTWRSMDTHSLLITALFI